MLRWSESYGRLRTQPDFGRFFGGGPNNPPPASAFRYLAYVQNMPALAPTATPVAGAGVAQGPLQQNFPAGAVILGITAAAYQEQTAEGAYQYAPSMDKARRDLFYLSFSYTNDENITPNGPALAAALLGTGDSTIFPGKELVIPPSQGILATASSTAVQTNLFVSIVYHSMVPRATG